jgi:polyhydroxybutyrate depolymerase
MRLFLILTLLTALTLTTNVFAQDDGDIDDDFEARTYELYVPESIDDGVPVPLLMVLHGASGTGARTQGWLGFDEIADTEGFIVVYPDGIVNNWDFGAGILTEDGTIEVDDVGYLVWLVGRLADEYPIDRERVYVAGMSNGGLMAYRLGCSAPETFKAIAGVAAPVYLPAVQDCSETPISVLFIHGTEDPILSWNGAILQNGQRIALSAPESLAFWAQLDQCNVAEDAIESVDLPDVDPADDTTARALILRDCMDGTQVHFYGVIGGGHTYPGRPFEGLDLEIGAVNMDFDASQTIWDFFSGLAD